MRFFKFLFYGFTTFLFFLFGFSSWDPALAQWGRYEGWHPGPGMMGGWGMGWFGGIFMIVFWILILVGLVMVIRWLFQSTGKGKNNGQSGLRALEILKERYARGEIDKAQFENMKRDLTD
jgi:putative membrane protein